MITHFRSKQIHQERMYQEYSLTRAEAQLKQMEKVLTQQNQCRELELTAMKGEIASLKKVNISKTIKYFVVCFKVDICLSLWVINRYRSIWNISSRWWRIIKGSTARCPRGWWRGTGSTRSFRGCMTLWGCVTWWWAWGKGICCRSLLISNITDVRAVFFKSQIESCFHCLGVFNTGFYFIVAHMDENIGMNPKYFHLFFCVCKLNQLFWRWLSRGSTDTERNAGGETTVAAFNWLSV